MRLDRVLCHWRVWGFLAVMALWPPAVSAAPITPERISTALSKLEALAEGAVANGAVPGLAIAVVHDDKVVFLKSFGHREAGKPELVDADTVFQIASLSKPVSATVVAALVGEGVLSWDSKVADLDPAFRLADPYPTAELTIRDLFAHRSGLPGTAGDDLEDIGYDRATILGRLRFVPPSSSFRAGYSYSNFGLTEGAIAAARATGKSWEEVAEEKLYRPLGMASTSSRYADFLKHADRAALHVRLDGVWTAKIKRNPDAQAPAGGVSSTARDLAQWVRLVLSDGVHDGKPLIAADALAQTHVPLMTRGKNPVSGGESFYGLGWNIEFGRHGLSWGHAGAFSVGARTLVTIFPHEKLGIVILTNAFPTGVPEGLSDCLADLVFDGKVEGDWIAAWNGIYGGLFGPAVEAAKAAYAAPPSPARPARPADAYAGRYASDFIGDAVVSGAGDGLLLKLGPSGARSYSLAHFDGDRFVTFPDAETPDRPAGVSFAIGPDGKATAMTVDFLDDNHLGTLQRVGD
ncbi:MULTISPECIES: serine hydrolase [unclassified Mesorhizobium]|uniref:serine hydrolase n=1 Tax=unclassified Mesorhizobium TaxID=325217 RepID=UPI000BB01A52|nr:MULTISPECIES: serine hydrolase [unclassified Mesorhizobium]TGT61073.1 serine hydrolase [Mesorhizobium sp. M00.F.Ca.ET.170.01.1.1]PBB84016.1 serine hydrolase [Mesorhizobium sp. WSM3876]RWB67438.1 MAG: serine hydrolase [Mesorhizobium sp.]RWB83761.1 MAG: serine hydrolase [Mesorhizobium sp.]RWE19462.1 MAG: serine hydrolase [Mesorhizobium sp.]